MAKGTHDSAADPRNESILISVNGALKPRGEAMAMDIGLSRAALIERLYETLDANNMAEGVHIRLMVTRGIRSTPYQDPRVVISGATIVITAEYKAPPPDLATRGLTLF